MRPYSVASVPDMTILTILRLRMIVEIVMPGTDALALRKQIG